MVWLCTTEQNPMAERSPEPGSDGIALAFGAEKQTLRGFGACFNELGWIALQKLPSETRLHVMESLFSPTHANLRFCRVPIGANDFASSWYSLDEQDGDFAMEHFSLARDERHLLPFIRQAQGFAPDLELFASPWSPPTWMKQPPVYNFGRLRNDGPTLEAYALYLEKFLHGFAAAGAPVRRLCVQNEVFADQKFPSCLWSGAQMRDFIRDHLGPRLAMAGLDTEIWLGTINGPFMDYEMGDWHSQNLSEFIAPVMLDEGAAKHVKGFALQWGAKHILPHLAAQYPDVERIQSECECGDGSNAYRSVFYMFDLMWQYFHGGATAFTYWNFALEADAVSTWGWRQNSLVTVDAQTGEARFNPEYLLLKHFSAHIPAGSRYVETTGRWAAYSMAFRTPGGELICTLANPLNQTVTLTAAGQRYALPAHSVNTLRFTPGVQL